jgi:hypothetical protein
MSITWSRDVDDIIGTHRTSTLLAELATFECSAREADCAAGLL